jgi:putative NADH-flavin reductase
MKVVLYGASGMIGSRILEELLSRGHQVTAVVRDPAKLGSTNADVKAGDVLSTASVAETAAGADAAISAYAPPPSDTERVIDATRALIAGLRQAHVQRFLMVGGAGSLEVAPGLMLEDAPDFPEAWKAIASAHTDALEVLKGVADLDWTYLSPAALIQPGERTGKFRLGVNDLITDAAGASRISSEDYAVAMVDELENPRHIRQRFTLGY